MKMDNAKKRREAKISMEQKEIYVSFLEGHDLMRTRKPSDKQLQSEWKELARLLNAAEGPKKTVEEWKKTFDNWRYVTHRKMRLLKASLNKTGSGKANDISLNDLEERASLCWGKIVMSDSSSVRVAGYSGLKIQNDLPINIMKTEIQDNSVISLEKSIHPAIPVASTSQARANTKKRKTSHYPQKSDGVFENLIREVQRKKKKTMEKISQQLERIADAQVSMATAQHAMANAMTKFAEAFMEKNK